MKKIRTYWLMTRPFTLIAPFVGCLSGAFMVSGLPGLNNIHIYVGALLASFLNAASNSNNQLFDIKIDKINKPFRPLPSGEISIKETVLFTVSLYVFVIICAYLINRQFFVLVLATACISFFYSAPPLRFKKYPYISNIAIAVSRGLLLIVAGWSLVGSVSTPTPWFVGLIFALYLLGAASTKDFADIKGDKKYGIMTLPVLYGAKKTAMIITPFFYLPFLLIPLGIAFNLIKTTAWPLTTLSLWGFYAAGLIMRNPSRLTLETNHISWIHMYLILITGQIGFALAYTII